MHVERPMSKMFHEFSEKLGYLSIKIIMYVKLLKESEL